MTKINLFVLFILSSLIISFYSCQSNEEGSSGENEFDTHGQAGVVDDVSALNILQIAISSEDHSTLVAGVKAAELENVLVNPGPLTVFAPNNAAFDKLPEGTLDELLKPENKNKLANIITSHAAPGTFTGNLLKDGTKIYLATGQYVDVKVKDGDTYVNGSKLLGTVDASNGVVHVIEDVWVF